MNNEVILLKCSACDADLTKALTPITSSDAMENLCTFAEGEAVTPRGHVLLLDKDAIVKQGKMHRATIPANMAWVHLDDLAEAVGLTPITKRLAGCCDISGIDGPNRICACGAHVGTQFSDCYEYHTFQPDPKTTRWIGVRRSENTK